MNSGEAIEVAAREPITISNKADPRAAFQRLADEHLDAAYRLATAILHNPSDAQDATHDAFVQAWRKWSTLRDQARFETWFDRILVNTCRDRLRRGKRWQPTDISADIRATGDASAQAHDREVLRIAISSLPVEQQIVVALRFYRDLTADQIAERLGVPVGTVHSRIHYALKRLQGLIEP